MKGLASSSVSQISQGCHLNDIMDQVQIGRSWIWTFSCAFSGLQNSPPVENSPNFKPEHCCNAPSGPAKLKIFFISHEHTLLPCTEYTEYTRWCLVLSILSQTTDLLEYCVLWLTEVPQSLRQRPIISCTTLFFKLMMSVIEPLSMTSSSSPALCTHACRSEEGGNYRQSFFRGGSSLVEFPPPSGRVESKAYLALF